MVLQRIYKSISFLFVKYILKPQNLYESIRYRFVKYILRPPKGYYELRFWKGKKKTDGFLRNDYYKEFYTKAFGLSDSFYNGKRILDIGCGPCGTLEWADRCAERVGLDPLAKSYLKLGAKRHKMKYVSSGSENIPFEDGHFDVVTSFNSLDHVDDVDQTIAEIKRVLTDEGSFLLMSELNHAPRKTEPQSFSWEVIEKLKPGMKIVMEKHLEVSTVGIYWCVQNGVPFDHTNPKSRPGILLLHTIKKSPIRSQDLKNADPE